MAVFKVPVVKGKGMVEIDTDKVPPRVWQAVVEAGLKALVNGGTSKITKATYEDEEELKAAAMEKAQERVQQMLDDTIKIAGTKAAGSKASGAVMTEARRLAKNFVKDQIKKAKGRIADYEPKEITAAANALLAQADGIGGEFIAQATKIIEERNAVASDGIDIASMIKVSASRKAKADKTAESRKAKALSAKQAGQTAKRKKPGAQAQA